MDLPTPIPAVWDNLAHEQPSRVIASIPVGDEVEDGYKDVTARSMADAINHASWFLERELGKSTTFETLCYLGPSDLRYPIIMSAAAKAGYKSFWTSPRNSLEAQLSLLESTDCTIFATPAEIPAGVTPILERLNLRHVIVPEQNEWLNATEQAKPYNFDKTYKQCCFDPLTVIHTSGSTGIPKPIVLPHGFACAMEAIINAAPIDGQKDLWRWFVESPGRLYTPFPMYHGAGIMLFHHFSQFLNQVPVLPPPKKPVTPELSNRIICGGLANAAFLPPQILDGISKVSEFTENLRKLRFVIFSGAPLSVEIGDMLRSKTRILNLYGQTETGLTHQYWVDDEDFAYVKFGHLGNFELQHHSDEFYEAVMVRKPGLEIYQQGFLTYRNATEIRTHDLFSRHPDPAKADLWIHRGRADDVIVFETGEKFNPTSMEKLVSSHPQIKSAMVVGESHFQSALLLEPVKDLEEAEEKEALLQLVWPFIEKANMECPAHGRVVKELVIFTKPGFPFVRTDKGSLKRRANFELYKDAIDAAYVAADTSLNHVGFAIDTTASMDELKAQLRAAVLQTVEIDTLNDEDNLYQLGMDSLQTLQLSRTLKAALQNSKVNFNLITPSFVYSNPSLRELSESVYNLCHSRSHENGTMGPTDEMEAILSQCCADISRKQFARPASKIILLTGSTGSFGSYLLHSLLRQASVRHVYCLNRTIDASSRQASVNKTRGLVSSFESNRTTFLTCDFSKPLLGLEQSIYDQLLGEVTHIIHNAWTVNFNLSLSTLAATNIVGVKSFVQFTVDSAQRAQLFFVSTIGTVLQWGPAGHQGSVPEEPIDDPAVAAAQGYAGSKWIAERLLDFAHNTSGIDVCSLRVGQIAGPVGTTQGSWNSTEWFPVFLTSCKSMGLLPEDLAIFNTIDWIPVNVLADVVVELVNCGLKGRGSLVYNLVNPSTATWTDLYPVVQRTLSRARGEEIKTVSYSEWVEALEKAASKQSLERDILDNPAIKLLEFFQGLQNHEEQEREIKISTSKAETHSPTLKACKPVNKEWMLGWLEQMGLAV